MPDSVSKLPLTFFNLSKDTFRLEGEKILPPGKIIGAHEVADFPMDLLKFTQLKELDLSSHHFRYIPEEIGKLEKLEALYMFGNNFKEFPLGLTKLSNLKKLQIAYNQIEKIPTADILKMSELEQLVLANNRIRLFPPDLLQLPKLTSGVSEEYSEYDKTLLNLDFRNNPIRNVPPEIIDKGYDAIFQYFESLQAGESRALNSAKLVIVGQGGVGKTVLSRKLIEPELAFEQIQEASTEGIDIRPWFISDGAEDRIRCNIWDFGGQEIYRSTHRFFLSKRSVYILVSETRREDDYQDFNYWLNTIQVQSDGSPVIIVINKVDERTKSINEASLKARFPEIMGFHYVSCKSGKGLKKLREEIQHTILQLPHTKDEVPLSWISIAQELEQLRLKADYMDYGDFLQICKKQGVSAKTASLLLEYFHDLGMLLYFKKDVILSSTIILNPDWGTNAVYNVLDTSEVVQNHGKFNYAQLYQIWDKSEYVSHLYGSLIALMKQFNLCIQLNDPQEYLVPQLLSPTAPSFTFEHKGKRVIEYHFPEFKPSGILTQILVELRPDIKEDICWKYGFLLAYGETEVLLTEEPISRKIRVQVAGPKKDEVLENIMGQIRDIHKKYPKLSYREYIPCGCEFRKAGDPSFLFEYERLQNFVDAGRNSLVCYQCIQEISIPSILKGITFRQERDEQSIKQLPVTEQHSILFLSANPLESGRSRLEKEYAEIEESIIRARMRDRFHLKAKWALRVEDLQRGMLEFSPRILHFSGHVDKTDHSMLLLETEAGEAKAVSAEALSSLFDLFKNTLECIILSAGFSLDLARPLLKRTSYVISMKENLSDRTAIIFSRSFYDAIGQGRKIPFAFEFGKSALRLEGIPETELPVFLSNG
ncbi:MAG: COR domain-containing protein [Bacteroidota bacterium]